jgi:hypothetical protein
MKQLRLDERRAQIRLPVKLVNEPRNLWRTKQGRNWDYHVSKQARRKDRCQASDCSSSSLSSHSKDGDMHLSHFSGHQACLLLSSLWLQALLPDNEPANFEAMALTYSAIVSFTLPKVRWLLGMMLLLIFLGIALFLVPEFPQQLC